MRVYRIRSLAVAAVLALAAGPAAAQILPQLPNYPVPLEGKFQYKAANNSMNTGCVGGSYSSGTFCVGPYSGWLSFGTPASTAPTPTGPAYDIYCVDFEHHAKTSVTRVNYTNVSSGNFLKTRVNDQARYMKASWLASKFVSTATSSWRNIHGAIWNIMYGTPAADAGINTWLANANTAASGGYAGFDFSKWTVITEQGAEGNGALADGLNQEFLVRNAVPEPATMILFGTGLLATLVAVGGFRRPDA